MKILLTIILLAVSLGAQTVTIKRPDGTPWTGTLQTHPRIMMDAATKARIKAPGGGALARGNVDSPAWQAAWSAMHTSLTARRIEVLALEEKPVYEALQLSVLGFYIDNYASFSGDRRQCKVDLGGGVYRTKTRAEDPTLDCYKWFAIDLLTRWPYYVHQSGLCWLPDKLCGVNGIDTTQISYYGDPVISGALAFSILREYLTPEEITQTAAWWINGTLALEDTHTPCENRIPSGAPTYNGHFTFSTPSPYDCKVHTATWVGEELPPSLIGKKAWHMTPWGTASFGPGDTTLSIPTPGILTQTFSCERSDGSYMPSSGSGVMGTATVQLSQPFSVHVSANRANALHAFSENQAIRVSSTGTLPAPLSADTVYYVKVQSRDKFQFALTPGGAAIDITTGGTGTHRFRIEGATGTCKAFSSIDETVGQAATILSLGAYSGGSQTFTFRGCGTGGQNGQRNTMWVLNEPGPNTCSATWISKFYDNVGTYVSRIWSSTSVGVLNANDLTLTVTDGANLPSVYPYWVSIGTSTLWELLKVTNRSGNVLTIERGQFNTQARAWPMLSSVQLREGGSDQNGWNNRTITRTAGHVLLALALADDSAYAREVLQKSTDYFRSNTYNATEFYNVIGTALNGYDFSRLYHYYVYISYALQTSTNNAVDYREPWMQEMGGLRFLYMTAPWDTDYLINIGYTPNNCKGLKTSSEQVCFEAPMQLQALYPGSDAARYAWKFSIDKGRITTANDIRISTRLITALLLHVSGTEVPADWTATEPSSRLFKTTRDDSTNPNTQYNVLLSKADWTPGSSQVAMFSTDFFGEKFYDPYTSHYIIGKGDYLIGQSTNNIPYPWVDTYNTNNFDMHQGNQATVVIGWPSRMKVQPSFDLAGANMEVDSSIVNDNLAFVRANTKDAWNDSLMGFTVPRHLRTLIHFKPGSSGTEQVVVLDDVETSAGTLIRSHIPYNMNGDFYNYQGITPLQEGTTSFNTDASILTSSGTNDNGVRLHTRVVNGGTLYYGDLGYDWTLADKTVTIGRDCTPTAPCRIKAGGNVFTYTAPAVLDFLNSTDAAGFYYLWADLTDGSLHLAHKTTSLVPNACTGAITCETGALTDWPAGVARLGYLEFSGGNLVACPGISVGTDGSTDLHCGYRWQRRLYMSSGYNATNGEFLVVHNLKTGGASPDPVTQLTTITGTFAGVEIGGPDPKVAVMAKGGTTALYTAATFTSGHSGTARYLVVGLQPGNYSITRNGSAFGSATVTGETHAVTFSGLSGAWALTQDGAAPFLALSRGSITVNALVGAAIPAETFTATASAATHGFTSSDGATWLSIGPGSGSLTSTPTTFTVSFDTTGLLAGTYNSTVAVTAPTLEGSPQSIPVTLVLSNSTPPPGPGPGLGSRSGGRINVGGRSIIK